VKVLDFGVAKILAPRPGDSQLSPGSSSSTLRTLVGALRDRGEGTHSARAVPGLTTRPGGLIGTLPYMSPEQMRCETIDERTDVWAVGITLYKMLLGRHPLQPLNSSRLLALADGRATLPSARAELPGLGPITEVIDRCLTRVRDHRLPDARALLQALQACQPSRRAVQLRDDDNPFTGLAAFQEGDADRFFGRDAEISNIVTQLRNQPLLTVVGPSGAGKSSLIRAGVIPALKQQGESWHSLIIRPGRDPLGALAGAMLDFLAPGSSFEATLAQAEEQRQARAAEIERLREQPGQLSDRLRTWATAKQRRILLFVDQFEELYTLGADEPTRRAVLDCLRGAADDASSPLRVITTIRSDFLETTVRELGDTSTGVWARSLLFLLPMGRDGLRQALTEPVRAADHDFDSAELVEDILDELDQTAGSLPLLQFTASRLWEARERGARQLTRASYQAMGGVAGTLAGHANTVLAGLTHERRRLARMVLQRLVTPEHTRAVVTLAELGELAATDDDREAIAAVIEQLAEARLVAIEHRSDDGEGGSATVELIHESLITRWPTLRRWLDDSREDADFLARVRTASQHWQRGGRSDDLLWRGRAAEDAQRWLARQEEHSRDAASMSEGRAAVLGAGEHQYLRAVVALAMRARRRQRHLVLAAIGLLTAVAVVVSVLALDARSKAATIAEQKAEVIVQKAEVEVQKAEAEKKEREARAQAVRARNASRMTAALQRHSDPTMSLALVRELEGAQELPSRWEDLARWAMHQQLARVVLSHRDAIYSAAFSPDGKRIVTASLDHTARVWRADGIGAPLVLRGHRARVHSARFSPDGKRVVTASLDNTARVWRADGTGVPLVLRGHQGDVTSADFSPDGKRIVTTSADKTARVWSADGSGVPLVLRGHLDRVTSAAFSPDGKRIVTASFDKTARVWSADGSGVLRIFRGHQKLLYSAAFSPDGKRIVTTSFDSTARVWSADVSWVTRVMLCHLS
ncbi:MAG: AAA family ATPase, partial [Myxococcota bacterium]